MLGMRSEHNEFVNALLDTTAFEKEIAEWLIRYMGSSLEKSTKSLKNVYKC
mgnify:CR=1 FL=1